MFRWNRKKWAVNTSVLLLCGLALVCAQDDRQQIVKTLQRRGKALEKKDLKLYLDCISSSYQDSDGQNLSRLQQRFAEVTQAFTSIDFESGQVLVYQDGLTAMVIQDFTLHFQPPGEDPFARKGRERIILRKEKGAWKIIEGL